MPFSQLRLFELIDKIGLPKGVVNTVNGGKDVVNGILENHNITDSTINERPKVQMSGLTPDQASALGIASVDRLILEVTFEASPESVIAILAELERSPEIASVSRVKIDRSISRLADDEHLVRATLTPEAWIAASSSGGPTSGPSEVFP